MKQFISILTACFFSAAFAGAAEPDELVELRAKYKEALKETRNPIKEKYLNQMKEMLTQFTKGGNLQEALAVRAAIRSFENESITPPVSTGGGGNDRGRPGTPSAPIAGTITLTGAEATLEGALKLHRGAIVEWIRPNCRAKWHKRDVPAGKYDVYFVYSAGSGQGGTVELRDFTYSFEVRIERTGWGSKRVKVGSIETRGGIGFHITSKTTSKYGVMSLREIQLVPAG